MKTVVISLGGSLVAPDGIDSTYLQSFVSFILSQKDLRCIVVVGGGKPARTYQEAARAFTSNKEDLDWIGIRATYLNAELVRAAFGSHAYPSIVTDPSKPPKTAKKIIVASGWKPGWSTDYDAVLLAKHYKAQTVLNLSNIDYVYDKDPRTFLAAKKFEQLTWKELQTIVGTSWDPGANAPFDPIATKLAAKHKLTVIICNGRNIDNLKNIFLRKAYVGTTIS